MLCMYEVCECACSLLDGVVSLPSTVYIVDEDDGGVEICIQIVNVSSCPIAFEFQVNTLTQMQTAGIYLYMCVHLKVLPHLLLLYLVLGEDYEHIEQNVTFPACSRRACFTVSVVDDLTVEHTEAFLVDLESHSSMRDQIFFEATRAVVNITDDDGICISTTHT